jgi:hypothetical protein
MLALPALPIQRKFLMEVSMSMSRRWFLGAATAAPLFFPDFCEGQAVAAAPVDAFPSHDPKTVLEMVTVSHGNVARVRALLGEHPALANAAWDWGFGDWETALGAASHVGNHEIAAALLAAGARPTLFSAAMLGQLDVVKAFIAAQSGAQRIRGPHGIPLLAHARAGGAADVVSYLESVQDSNVSYRNEPLPDPDRIACIGEYVFAAERRDRFVVSATDRGVLLIRRDGSADRNLFHHGAREFHPAGAEAVRIRFASGNPSPSLIVEDGPLVVNAKRV